MIELGQTPIYESELALFMIYHDVVRFHVSMHYAFAVTVVKRFEEFEYVKSDIVVDEFRIQAAEVGVVDVFEDQ